MHTEVVAIDPSHPDPAVVKRAAEILCAGGLVAFPTETVYGLGANALDPAAVRRIFAAKGRPATNPLIVHVWDEEAARTVVTSWPPYAHRLAASFWPGPLSLVLPKSDRIPPEVTAGGPTVALRVPAHPVALALLRACRLPLAAPSANRSTELSPSRAEHVLRGLQGRVEMILDAGPTSGGLESTVLDLTVAPPRLLRPGLVTPAEIEAVIGPIVLGDGARGLAQPSAPLKSPGLLERHYAPRTPLECVEQSAQGVVEKWQREGLRVGWLRRGGAAAQSVEGLATRVVVLPDEPRGYAAGLYAALHDLDEGGLDRIVVDMPPATQEWLAVRDRLRRASQPT